MPSGINLSFERLSRSYRQVGYVLLTRAPVAISSIARKMLPLDLHVLSLQLAFILSQDQTLHCKIFLLPFRACFVSVQETDFFHFPCFQGLLTVVFRSSHIYIIYRTTSCTTSQSVYLKSFKELSFLKLPFQRESVCKGKAFFRNLQIFSKFFLKKFFRRFSEGVRLILSRSLAHPQGKILGAASGTLFHSLSFTQSVIFSGSPSRKRLQRYRLFPFLQLLPHTFLQYFFRVLSNSLIYFML